jgi:hypothetical protein
MSPKCSNQVSELRPGVASFHQTITGVEHSSPSRPNGIRNAALAAALGVSLLSAFGPSASAEIPPPLNGAQPRPVYVIGHNPNTIADVLASLEGGANALEPDVTQVNDCSGQNLLVDFDSDGGAIANCGELQWIDWCKAVNTIAQTNKNLAMVLVDIKDDAMAATNGPKIMDAVRRHLNTNGVNLNIIYSTGYTNYGSVFDLIYTNLNEREGVQFDADDRPGIMMDYFFKHGYFGNIGYGDGTSLQYGPLTRAMDRAVFQRASIGYPQVISDVYLINLEASMNHFLNCSVDGIIVKAGNESQLTNVIAQSHPELRLATRDDNPFKPLNEAYGLQILTDNDGTDAEIKFTLHGCKGNATITVNSGLFISSFPVYYDSHRFEAGNYDWVTIPSKDLGEIQSITIENHGGANWSQWQIAEIRVKSLRYVGAGEYAHTSIAQIPTGATTNLTLTRNFTLPQPTIQCPGNQVLANNPGQCGAVLNFAPQVDGPCNDVTAVCDPPSGTLFPVGTSTVTCYATNTSGGGSAPCTFTVTVQDTEPPVITCPGPMVVDATSPAGAVVQFPVIATDNCGATVVCTPASGSVLPIGDTFVQSTATDPSANQVSCSFGVHVKGALEQTQDLLAAVNGLNTKPGVKNGLLVQLNTALAGLQNNHPVVACGALEAFIDLVSAQSGKAISVSDANYLIAAATQIRAVIGCTP